MDRWCGKVAIVAGASSGIGASIAEHLVKAGLLVVGLARRVERVEENAKKLTGCKGKLYGRRCDLTIEQEILDAFVWTKENLGPVHILINNAGVMPASGLAEGETAAWRTLLDTNILSYTIATREAIKIMKEHGIDGHIVHINSIAGLKAMFFPGSSLYSASKFALTSYHECLRQELITQGSKIKLSSIHPGYVQTEFINQVLPEMKEITKDAPYVTSDDVAGSIMYVLGTPPNVQIHELVIKPVGETF